MKIERVIQLLSEEEIAAGMPRYRIGVRSGKGRSKIGIVGWSEKLLSEAQWQAMEKDLNYRDER